MFYMILLLIYKQMLIAYTFHPLYVNFPLSPCSQYNRWTWAAQRAASTSKRDQLHSGKPQAQHSLQVLFERHDYQGLWPHCHKRGLHNGGRRWGLALWMILQCNIFRIRGKDPGAVFYPQRWLHINCKRNKTCTKVCFSPQFPESECSCS